jgi:uncharacterized membrane protein
MSTDEATAAVEAPLGFERLVLFSDAVFAIVITLLVLPLTAEFELPEGTGDVAAEVLSRWPAVLTFAISFLVIGQFWLAHHRMFGHLDHADTGLAWFNLVSLLTVSFLPFPAAVLGNRSNYADRFPVVFYAASLTLTSITFSAMWLYAVRRGLATDRGGRAGARDRHVFTLRSFATTGAFLVSVGAAVWGLLPAVLCWTVLLPVARAAVGRRVPGST